MATIIDADHPDLEWDQNEFYWLRGQPFNGIVTDSEFGWLYSVTTAREGMSHGYFLELRRDGSIERFGWDGARCVDGIRIDWSPSGSVESIEKRWSGGTLVAEVDLGGKSLVVVERLDAAAQKAFLDDPVTYTRYARLEPLQVLYAEARSALAMGAPFASCKEMQARGIDVALSKLEWPELT